MQKTALKGFPLSLQQHRLWSTQEDQAGFRSQCYVSVEGKLDSDVLLKALQHLIERHMIVRTSFRNVPGIDVPMQVAIQQDENIVFQKSLEGWSPSEQEAFIENLFVEWYEAPVDLENPSPMRVGILRVAAEKHQLLLSLPALCADLVSLRNIVDELSVTYALLSDGRHQEEEPLQYVDVSVWQNDLLKEEGVEGYHKYWSSVDLSSLSNMRLPYEIGTSETGNPLESRRIHYCRSMLPSALFGRIKQIARQQLFSEEAFLLACWQVVLRRLVTGDAFVMGVACDGRELEDLEQAIGLYTRFVPFTYVVDGGSSFLRLAQQTQQYLDEARKHQHYYTWNVSSQAPAGSTLLFPISFAYIGWPAAISRAGLTFSPLRLQGQQENTALQLQIMHSAEALQITIQGDGTRISAKNLAQLAHLYHMLVESATQTPEQEVGRLPLLRPEERAALRPLCEPAPFPLPAEPLSRLFERQARERGTALAVVCGDQSLSYAHLNGRANALARRLRVHGIGANALVGLHLPRSLDLLVSLLAVLKAGGAYVPIDPQLPQARQVSLLAQSGPLVLLSRPEERALLPPLPERVLVLPPEATEESQEDLETAPSLEDLAYVLYTSGSTGTPKGVMVSQGNLLAYAVGITQRLDVASGAQWATVSTLSADLGNTAIVGGWLSGGCVHLLPYEVLTSGEALARYQQQWGLDVLKIVPSHFRALLRGCPPELREHLVPRLALVFGGERLTWDLVEEVRALNESCQLYNHYGPTETTVGVLLKRIEGQERGRGAVALGRPLPNSRVYVVDGQGQVLPPGVSGELWIGGAGVAQGYLREPERTEERFVSWDPWGSGTRERVYRSGDVGRMSEEGEFSYEGRQDRQVKVRGYRVELGEIEQVLGEHEGVWESVVVSREEGEGTLVGYVVSRQQPGPGEAELRSYLRERLPEYMVPGRIARLAALPLSRNGKIAYEELPEVEGIVEEEAERQAGRTPVEEVLEGIWQEVLGQEEIGREENFFERGGHSLLATQVISRIRQSIGVELRIGSLFEAPTIAGMGRKIEQAWQGEQGEQERRIARVSREQDLPLSFAQQRLWFLDQLHPGSAAYNRPVALRLEGTLHVRALEDGMREIVRRHEVLRTTFRMKEGVPVQIIGPSSYNMTHIDLRSLPAFEQEELARQLSEEEAGRPFDLDVGPMLRTTLLWLNEHEHILLLTLHHIVTDGWSNGIFVRELSAMYAAFSQGTQASLPELPIQYADFACWQRRSLDGALLERQLDYWKKQLGGVSRLNLPGDRPRPSKQSQRGANFSFSLSKELARGLTELSRREGASLFMTVLAAFQLLLSRYAGQDDIVVGTDIANRTRVETEQLIGFFVNLLVLRTDLSGEPSFRDLLKRVRTSVLGAYAHQDAPFEKLVEMIEPDHAANRMPLVQVLFVLQNIPSSRDEWRELQITPLPIEVTSSKFDLALFLQEGEHGLHSAITYSTDLFDRSTIEQMSVHFETLLNNIVSTPDERINALEIYSEAEKAQKLSEKRARKTLNRQHLKMSKDEEEVDMTELMANMRPKEQ